MTTTALIDCNNVFLSTAMSLEAHPQSKGYPYQEDQVRKMMVTYINKHLNMGKTVVMAVDQGSWRKDVFPPYKAARAASKEASSFDYTKFMTHYRKVVAELAEHSPALVIEAHKTEADDTIAVLSAVLDDDQVVIHSTDKDLLQLQLYYQHVTQFSPVTWKTITPQEKAYGIIDHIIRGDAGDGVPNILSDDRCFVDKVRQTIMTAGRFSALMDAVKSSNTEELMGANTWKRWLRNKQLIDLREVPADIVAGILACYEQQLNKERPRNAYSDYLASHGLV